MANIMSRKDVKNKVHRSGFDLSHRVLFTQKTGEVLPVSWYETLPGDKFNINLRSFLRTVPFETASFARLRQYIDVYFVPYRLLWKEFPVWFAQTGNTYSASDLTKGVSSFNSQPYMFVEDILKYLTFLNSPSNNQVNRDLGGLNRFHTSAKLLSYMGYGEFLKRNSTTGAITPVTSSESSLVSNRPLNMFPLLAYQKICDDFFRYKEWTKSSPWRYNVDFIKSAPDLHLMAGFSNSQLGAMANTRNLFDINYCQYDKDMFNGLIPEPQYGSESSIFTEGYLPDLAGTFYSDLAFLDSNGQTPRLGTGLSPNSSGIFNLGYVASSKPQDDPVLSQSGDFIHYSAQPIGTSFSVLSLRYGEMLQKWKEVTISSDPDFADQIYAHWNEHVSHYASQKCRYLGGISSVIDIQEIVNTNLAETGSDANAAGIGRLSQDGHLSYDVPDGEVGVIMVVSHVKPVIEWDNTSVIHPAIYRHDVTDYPVPEYDSLGMEALRGSVFKSTKDSDRPLGYGPRYLSFKTNYDRVLGGFLTMPQWTLQHSPYVEHGVVDWSFFTVSPHVTDNLFLPTATGLVESDLFYNSLYLDVKVARNLDYDGLPY